VVFTEMAWYFS